MKPVIAALAFLGAVACATSASGVDPRLEYSYNSSVNGVIVVGRTSNRGSNHLEWNNDVGYMGRSQASLCRPQLRTATSLTRLQRVHGT